MRISLLTKQDESCRPEGIMNYNFAKMTNNKNAFPQAFIAIFLVVTISLSTFAVNPFLAFGEETSAENTETVEDKIDLDVLKPQSEETEPVVEETETEADTVGEKDIEEDSIEEDEEEGEAASLRSSGGSHHSYSCKYGTNGELSYSQFVTARSAGLIDYSISTDINTGIATVVIENDTNCTFPASLSVYKMFDQVLSHQQFFDGSGLVNATSSTILKAKLPSCMAQIDFWYGLAPQVLLDSNPYGAPPPPVVLAYAFIHNNSGEFGNASGQFCNVSATNTPPVITLIGNNPFSISVGNTFTDPGATSTDAEDGNLTSQIVATGTVNTSVEGTYTRTYSVTDSGGLSASTTRQVIVTSSGTTTNPCVMPDNKGDSANETIGQSYGGETSVNTYLANAGYLVHPINDQKEYQSWNLANATTSLEVEFIGSWSSAANVFGYYVNNNTSTFVPVLKANSFTNPVYPGVPQGTALQKHTFAVAASSIQFAVHTHYNNASVQWSSVNSQNSDGLDHMIAYNATATSGSYLLGFEDLAGTTSSDRDFNDLIVKVTVSGCFNPPAANTPPTISIIGSNPLDLIIGSTFTDPGATSTDAEDGDLTSQIVSTSTVSTTTLGSYTVTYSVTDSGGLSATTSRQVNVTPAPGGGGGGGTTTPTANIAVTKTSDKSTANVGDDITYTIGVTNSGTATATGVTITDVLPSSLEFVSASTTIGSFSTSTGIWAIGNFAHGSSTNLTIVAKIKTGTEGQKITNTVVSTSTGPDSNPGDDTTSVDVNVNTPGGGGGGNGGGGGGGGGGTSGGGGSVGGHRRVPPLSIGGGGQVLGATSCSYLRDYLRRDWDNDQIEVLKLQAFLNGFEKENLSFTGVFDDATFSAVSRFQDKYFDDILEPWGHTAPTGFVYILTKKKVNEIFCNTMLLLTPEQQNEITAFRNYIQSLPAGGMTTPGSGGNGTSGGIGPGGTGATGTDKGTTSTSAPFWTGGILGDAVRNAAVSLFALPESLSDKITYAVVLLIVLAAIYSAASLLAGGPALTLVERAKVRRRKLLWNAAGLLIAIAIASIVSYFYLVLPLAIIFLIVMGMLIFGNGKSAGTGGTSGMPPATGGGANVPMLSSYDKSLDEAAHVEKQPSEPENKPNTPEAPKETPKTPEEAKSDDSKKGFKGILE